MATHKMKQIKQNMSKETDELDNEEENEELFGDISKDDLSREIPVFIAYTYKIVTSDKSHSHKNVLLCVNANWQYACEM